MFGGEGGSSSINPLGWSATVGAGNPSGGTGGLLVVFSKEITGNGVFDSIGSSPSRIR